MKVLVTGLTSWHTWRPTREAQAAALRSWMPTWDEFVARCDEIVRLAVTE